MIRKSGLILTTAAMLLASGTCAAAQVQWYTAVSENSENSVLNYTVYDSSDRAAVEPISSCPNDDASEWNVSGVKYEGINYIGSLAGGIRTNITAYIESGDRLRISFDYRSPGYESFVYDVTPVIEVKSADGTISGRYKFAAAPQSDVWTSYTSGESESIKFGDGDSVSLSLRNERGFWHMKDLVIERYGEEKKTPFISDLEIGGAAEGGILTDGEVNISGSTGVPCTLYTAFYNNGRLLSVQGQDADGDFELSAQSNGADTMKLLAWNGMTPETGEITVNSDGSGNYKQETSAMKEKYRDSFLIGNIFNSYNLSGEDRDILLKHFNVITGENNMKPEILAPAKNYYNWTEADAMVDFAEENGLDVIGHTLVWHKQTPAWFTEGTAEEVWQNMETYIKTVVGRYKGRVKGWDVVNEAIRDNIDQLPLSWSDYIRKESDASGTPWFRALKDADYIYRAFLFAHEADPDAELYYNDYNLDMPYKREAAALLVEHINNKYKEEYDTDENLIDAIGMQSHYSLETNVDEVRNSIDRFREIGVKVNITELDICINRVDDNGEGADSGSYVFNASDEMKQAVKYAELMTVYEDNADIIDRVTFWGYSDGKSWRSAQYPLMFNADLTPKKAFYAIMEPENYR